jgi:septal ring factor EnvC (AmiA/AmiB activator)
MSALRVVQLLVAWVAISHGEFLSKREFATTKIIKELEKVVAAQEKELSDAEEVFNLAKCAHRVALQTQNDIIEAKTSEIDQSSAEIAAQRETIGKNGNVKVEQEGNKAKLEADRKTFNDNIDKEIAQLEKDLKEAQGNKETVRKAKEQMLTNRDASESHKDFMKAFFLQLRGESTKVAVQSRVAKMKSNDEILGILMQMEDQFKQESAELSGELADKKAFKAKKDKYFGDAIQGSDDRIKESAGVLTDKVKANADSNTNLANAKKALKAAQDAIVLANTTFKDATKVFDDLSRELNEMKPAVREAIAILSSPEAFSSFKKVKATNDKGTTSLISFLQVSNPRQAIARKLHAIALASHSFRLGQVANAVRGGNSFASVFSEIDKMIKVIKEEEKADDEQDKWCKDERKETEDKLKEMGSAKGEVEKDIAKFGKLKGEKEVAIEKEQKELATLLETRKKTKVVRAEAVAKFNEEQQDMRTAVETLDLAIQKLDETVKDRTSAKNKDSFKALEKVIGMLKFVRTKTVEQKKTSFEGEGKAMKDHVDTMKKSVDSEEASQRTLVSLQGELTDAETSLENSEKGLQEVEKNIQDANDYLAKIAPGCDFIKDNIVDRKKNRVAETKALNDAIKALKNTKLYKQFAAIK